MEEIWKDIEGWEGLYQVSNMGNVRTLHYKKPYLMHPVTDAKGYKRVSFTQRNITRYKRYGVHRLVAQVFVPNPDNLPQINHKDENKQNNCADNLEWCTAKYNSKYGNHLKNVSESRKGIVFTSEHLNNLRISHAKSQGRRVIQYDINGCEVARYPSISDAARSVGSTVANISACCRHKNKSACSYKWEYE